MKKSFLISSLFAFASVFSASSQEYNHRHLKIMETMDQSEESVANPTQFDLSYSHDNLRLFPIIASTTFTDANKDIGQFTLLKDAIEEEKIVITEIGATDIADSTLSTNVDADRDVSGSVNTLFAKNNSQDTIFIMAGEVVKGGKQDRVIGQDVVIAPGEETNLSAFCVERSRWTTKESNAGQFTGYYNVLSMDIRKTVTTEKSQHEVWNKVGKHTSMNSAESETEAYTNLANSEAYQTKLTTYIDSFKDAFKNDERVIGVIAVTGEEIMGVDIFATHDLFISNYPNLLHSYVGNAITNGAPVNISNEDVFAYLDTILNDESKQEEIIEQNGSILKHKGKRLHISFY